MRPGTEQNIPEQVEELEMDLYEDSGIQPTKDLKTVESFKKVFEGEGIYEEGNNALLMLFRKYHTYRYT